MTEARHQWLTPVILATKEAEIRMIAIWASPGKKTRLYLKKRAVEWFKW
jgi:hypothetical protein